ncbi:MULTISPECIES: hypothetical protein [Nostoc]|nr:MULTISPECIES: hypothetical protein [Nostoc]
MIVISINWIERRSQGLPDARDRLLILDINYVVVSHNALTEI